MSLMSGRRQERHSIKGDVCLRQRGLNKLPATVYDLSLGGCRIQLTKTVQVGDVLWVSLPGLESNQATVRWTDGWTAGVEFEKTLHPSVLEMVEKRIRDQK